METHCFGQIDELFSQVVPQNINPYSLLYAPQHKKTCLRRFVKNKSADQPVHQHSLISAFIIRLLESIISSLATSEISIF